jgi:hypothetical protein
MTQASASESSGPTSPATSPAPTLARRSRSPVPAGSTPSSDHPPSRRRPVTETTDTQPWAQFGETPAGFGDPPLPPGDLLAMRREEERLRVQEQAAEADRRQRADDRQALAEWNARQRALRHGLPWSPSRPFEFEPTIYQRSDALFALYDAEQRADDRRALQAAGLDHLIPSLVGGQSPPPVVEPAGVPASRSRGLAPSGMAASGPAAAQAHPVGSRIRAAFDRWAASKGATRTGGVHGTGPTSGCGCAACRANATVTGQSATADSAAGLPAIRTYYQGERVR